MGGGGGSSSYGPEELEDLLKRARERLRRLNEGRRNVFLSFAMEDEKEVNLLRGQSKNENSEIEFNDWSVKEPYDSEHAEYIKDKIRERLVQCSVVVVYVSEATPDSRWVTWEVEESLRLGKKVLGVHKGDAPPSELPHVFEEHRVRAVPWKRLATELKNAD